MIKRWTIANFKSIRDETTLELAPLTIFAGANSSGKSTVLQSILLIAQTFKHKITPNSVVLNGYLFNFGQFRDLKSNDTDVDRISIGWHCEPTACGIKINSVECELSFDARLDPGEVELDTNKQKPRDYNFELDANIPSHDPTDKKISVYFSRLWNNVIKTIYDDMSDIDTIITNKRKQELAFKILTNNSSVMGLQETSSPEEILPSEEALSPDRYFILGSLNLILDKTRNFGLSSNPKIICIDRYDIGIAFASALVGKAYDFTLPYDILMKTEVNQLFRDIQKKVVLSAAILIEKLEKLETELETEKSEYGSRHLSKLKLSTIFTGASEMKFSLNSLAHFIRSLKGELSAELRARFSDRTVKLGLSLANDLSIENDSEDSNLENGSEHPPKVGLDPMLLIDENIKHKIPLSTIENIDRIEYIDRFFSDQVKYLGPLRSEPKYLYPFGILIDPVDVGVKGEQTASVLYKHRETIIEYLPVANFPPANSESPDINRSPISKPLKEAVLEWAQYLGIFEDIQAIQATDHEKSGYRIRVGQDRKIKPFDDNPIDNPGIDREYLRRMHDDGSQNLTHIGVGVSQALPILVMGLLSRKDTTLIFEQPELHLHPLVQTRLADFFLSMALLKKQCIIETHSEHLINRLRYRTAAASVDQPLTDISKIYFVEKHKGASHFEEVVVNEYGSIQNWPSGFFDQSYTEAENILMASIKKRKKIRKDQSP